MSKQIQDAYICAAIRTPVGKAPRGVFKTTRPDDLLAHCLKGIIQKYPNLNPMEIGDVITGCAMPEAEQGMNVARISLLLAGLPNVVPGMTINRFCSSGIQAVAMAADRIKLGEADLMIASGTESMSLIPMMGHKVVMNPSFFADENIAISYGMGITAEKVADKWKITREAQDNFALESHRRASEAIKNGEFSDEILPYTVTDCSPGKIGEVLNHNKIISHDEGPRPDSTYEALAKLRPVFAARGSVTAGNSSQMSDGAAAILLASEKAIKKFNLTPLARFVSFAVAGVPPEIMGIGPKEAIPKVLKQAGIKQNQIDWFELNEAFAAQSLAVINDLGLDPKKVNPLGGAIALGHPLGATGAIRTATIVNGMKRRNNKYGIVTMCIGTGMGAAGLIEMV
ncbi:acetyl-CoA C-acyltransferase [Fluviispira multicolorata]|uniref:acetyl-CoA C-acyltransferase n=1 Tax=Fluviispira multicolorata TaxID=2654512 RepID=A0A833JBA3_9BACT|nr:acetyl-CoA C-acyltransferase [Fluviispira multicolorata]KAB8029104.1 acetyl-CoA C-acyltransferase [Fluviispira multicolorata]